MLLAHPPISRIEVMPTRGKCCVAASSGLTQGHLHEYEATAWRVNHGRELDEFLAGKFGLSEITPYRDHILAANTWRRLAKNFDEITGHEMLWILSASSKQLEGLLLEGVGGYVDDVDEDSGDAMADDHSKFDCCVSTHPFHHSCAESAGMASETQDMLLGPPAELNNLQSSSHGPVSKTGLQQHSHTHPELRTRRRTV